MAATAANLNTKFRYLCPNCWSIWTETCSVTTGWFLDWKELKSSSSEIQDGQGELLRSASVRRPSCVVNSFFKWHILFNHLSQFQNTFTQMFLLWPFTKIAQMVLFHWTRWPPELKVEKKIFKRHLLLGQWPDFKIFAQKCFSNGPLPKLLKWFRSAAQNGHPS